MSANIGISGQAQRIANLFADFVRQALHSLHIAIYALHVP